MASNKSRHPTLAWVAANFDGKRAALDCLAPEAKCWLASFAIYVA